MIKKIFYFCLIATVCVCLTLWTDNVHAGFFWLFWLYPLFFFLKRESLEKERLDDEFGMTFYFFSLYGLMTYKNWVIWLTMAASVFVMVIVVQVECADELRYKKYKEYEKYIKEGYSVDHWLDENLKEIGLSSAYREVLRRCALEELNECYANKLLPEKFEDVILRGVGRLIEEWEGKSKTK